MTHTEQKWKHRKSYSKRMEVYSEQQ
jgi:hypothetical protein